MKKLKKLIWLIVVVIISFWLFKHGDMLFVSLCMERGEPSSNDFDYELSNLEEVEGWEEQLKEIKERTEKLSEALKEENYQQIFEYVLMIGLLIYCGYELYKYIKIIKEKKENDDNFE